MLLGRGRGWGQRILKETKDEGKSWYPFLLRVFVLRR